MRPWNAILERVGPEEGADAVPMPMIGNRRLRRATCVASVRNHMMFAPRAGRALDHLVPPCADHRTESSAPAASTERLRPASPEPAGRGSRPAPPPRTLARGRGCVHDVQSRRFVGGWAPQGSPAPKPKGRIARRTMPRPHDRAAGCPAARPVPAILPRDPGTRSYPAIDRIRRGLSTVSRRISASPTPRSSSRGRNWSARYAYPFPP